MRAYVGIALVAVAGFWTWGCGGSGYGSSPSTPTAPTSTPSALTLTPGATDLVTVNVVAINGAQSFSPNPATLPAGQRIVWHNIDTVTHRVVLNDGSYDSGNLAPGASSQPMTVGARARSSARPPVMAIASTGESSSTLCSECLPTRAADEARPPSRLVQAPGIRPGAWNSA
jgi:plastocyanin